MQWKKSQNCEYCEIKSGNDIFVVFHPVVGNKLPYTFNKGMLLCYSFYCDEDEMDPEIEEAFEKFCMESDAKRKKLDLMAGIRV